MSLVRVINNDGEFQAELAGAGTKLVVADFTATWCGPCQRIAPVFDSFSVKYSQAVFLKIDVDKCQDTAAIQQVSAMPTFILYKNKVKVDRIQGADPNSLETKIKQYYEPSAGACEVAGHMDLTTFLMKEQLIILNGDDDHPPSNILKDDASYIDSDCDAELILSFRFSQPVKIHSIKLKGPNENGPKSLRLYANMPSIDFSATQSLKAVQEIELTSEDLAGKVVNLKYVKLQNVNTLDLLVNNNQNGSDVTRLNYVQFIGSPINATNMDDFKRVAGKAGESH